MFGFVGVYKFVDLIFCKLFVFMRTVEDACPYNLIHIYPVKSQFICEKVNAVALYKKRRMREFVISFPNKE